MDILNGLDFNFSELDTEELQWDALIEAAVNGNVIPVIGPDVLCDFPDGSSNVNEFILKTIDGELGLHSPHTSFSKLYYDPQFVMNLSAKTGRANINRNVLYNLVNNIFANPRNIEARFRPSRMLCKLLELKLFPFVITTSFAPVVENEMRRVWEGRDVRVLSFSNDPSKDRKPGIGDIHTSDDMSTPTVYYMFGRTPGLPHRYVLTDYDMLEFCKSFMSSQTRPDVLCERLRDKYLLMLGCGYSDWLFRFIWHCMNKTADSKTKGMLAKDEKTQHTLLEYLRRIDTFLPENKTPDEIVDEICKRVAAYQAAHGDERFSRPVRGTDVFISYSRSDSNVAEKLYQYLTDAGLNVWYDKMNLLGGVRFQDEIEDAIETTKIFLPIITDSIRREAMDAHVYRLEWKKAITMQESMGDSRNFIIPVNEEGFDFYNAEIPRGIKSHNSITYGRDLNFSAVLSSVNHALDSLAKYKIS